jgi:hypothetical protein
MRPKFPYLITRLLPLSDTEIGEFCDSAVLLLLWRVILRTLCKLFPKLFNLCLLYSVLPEASNIIVDLGCGTGYTFSMLKAIDYKGKLEDIASAWTSSSLTFERPNTYMTMLCCATPDICRFAWPS